MAIHIKEKNKGKFTKSAKAHGKGVQEYAHDVMNNPKSTPLQRKRANFAIQAKKWHHAQDGISMPVNFQAADDEMFRRFQQEQLVREQNIVPTFQDEYSNIPITQEIAAPKPGMVPSNYSPEPHSYNGMYGNIALGGLLAVDELIPNRRQPSQVVRPLNSYNPNPYGTGSRAIAQNGTSVPMRFNKQAIPLSYEEQQSSLPTITRPTYSSILNPQQQYFYRALQDNSGDISNVYKGFNEELVGVNSDNSQVSHIGSSPFSGTYILNNDDKKLLQDEYLNYKKYKGNNSNYFNDLRKRAANNPNLNNLIPAASFALGQSYENGGKISNLGYKMNSPDRNEPHLTVPSNHITMQGVPHPVYGVDDYGNQQLMYPNNDYVFPGNYVREIPVKRMGGKICKAGGKLGYNEGETYNLTDREIKALVAQGYEIKIH